MLEAFAFRPACRPLSAEQETYLRARPPGEAVLRALRDLLERESYLLYIDANERSIDAVSEE